jgi:hypothetical protein
MGFNPNEEGNVTLTDFQHVVPNHKPIKDSGKHQSFDTGSKRDSRDGKGRFDLLPMRALQRLARHFEGGAKKYGDRNWEKGQPISRYMDSAIRHACKYIQGERDEDHLIAAAWNIMCAADTEERIAAGLLPKELNDMPTDNNGG